MPRLFCSSRLNVTKIWKCCFFALTSVAVTLFIYQILFLDGSDHPEYKEVGWTVLKDTPSALREKLVKSKSNNSASACPSLCIHSKPTLTPSATCHLPKVKEDACAFARTLFTANASLNVCNKSQLIDACTVEKTSKGIPKVECHITFCGSSDMISAGFIDPLDGSLSWKHFSFLQDVEKALNHYIQNTPREDYFPFTFLRCDEFWNPKAKTRLFLLPPRSAEAVPRHKKISVKPINVNLILIDSVSRPHFYRSLPQTVKAFRATNRNSSIPAMVLDFEFFHGIKHRTFETVHALLSGEVLQTEKNINPVPVGARIMFERFKKAGYQTLWQEDMCWTYEWGLARDLKVMNDSLSLEERWRYFNAALKNNFIDLTGMTHSSCEVLKSFDVPEFFHNPPKICYGGKHYHSFFLNYLQSLLQEDGLNSPKKPLFSFTMLDVGHEGSGLRIQTLDSALSDFVTTMAAEQNTLSIILSDHGNTYGSYPRTMEGRFEVFQPHLFMIIPRRVAKILGKDRVQALIENQKRLVSVVDLHHTIMALTDDHHAGNTQTRVGLFQSIARNRTCEDLPLLMGSLCACQGWETKVQANAFHVIIAEFALGQLNGIIQAQYLRNSNTRKPVSGFGSCERLVGERFQNVREKRVDGSLSVSLDIVVQNQELFAVEVELAESGNALLDMKFIQYTRFSEYGAYRICADEGVDLRLCICKDSAQENKSGGKTQNNPYKGDNLPTVETGKPADNYQGVVDKEQTPQWQLYGDVFSSATKADNMHGSCLFILSREHESGVVFEAANSCSFVRYTIELHVSLDNLQVSERVPIHREVGPGTVHFLLAVIQLDPNIIWSWKYTVNFSWKVLSEEGSFN